jgi:hypothetical protein
MKNCRVGIAYQKLCAGIPQISVGDAHPTGLKGTNLQAPAYTKAGSRRQAKSQIISNPAMAGPILNDAYAFVSDFYFLVTGNYLGFGFWDFNSCFVLTMPGVRRFEFLLSILYRYVLSLILAVCLSL